MTRSDRGFRFIGKFLVYLLAVVPPYAMLYPTIKASSSGWALTGYLWLFFLASVFVQTVLWPDPKEGVL